MRRRRNGFSLLELLAVVAIIFTLAGILMAGATIARRRARIERTNSTLHVLATACEDYWAEYHDYPYPEPNAMILGSISQFRTAYWRDDYWTDEGKNVALVYLLSEPRSPHPWLDLQQKWFEKTATDIPVPGGRVLYRVVDGFQNVIRVQRPSQYYYVNTYIKLTSAGPDGDFDKQEDNIEVYVKR